MSRHTDEQVRDLSERVYRLLLDRDGTKGDVDLMIKKDGDGGKKLRARAGSYDRLSRVYLELLTGA